MGLNFDYTWTRNGPFQYFEIEEEGQERGKNSLVNSYGPIWGISLFEGQPNVRWRWLGFILADSSFQMLKRPSSLEVDKFGKVNQ
jgi:hypothetical protein